MELNTGQIGGLATGAFLYVAWSLYVAVPTVEHMLEHSAATNEAYNLFAFNRPVKYLSIVGAALLWPVIWSGIAAANWLTHGRGVKCTACCGCVNRLLALTPAAASPPNDGDLELGTMAPPAARAGGGIVAAVHPAPQAGVVHGRLEDHGHGGASRAGPARDTTARVAVAEASPEAEALASASAGGAA